MDFTDQWRGLWPIAWTFAAPSLIVGPKVNAGPSSSQLGPLLFPPSSSPLLLQSLPALSPSLPLSSLLCALQRRNSPSSLLIFFPAGDNLHFLACLPVSLHDPDRPEVGELLLQNDGFKHPFHRIHGVSVAPWVPSDWDDPPLPGSSEPLTEGFLMATTLYSINWFRIETRVFDSGVERPSLVPVGKHGFRSSVVHACWNPHFQEECAVLLENGDLCWFNLSSRRGGKIRVMVDGGDPGGWLGFEYGEQPWILVVGCWKAVFLVDLREEKGTEPRVLARAGGGEDSIGDRFLGFCKASFSSFHVSVLTEQRLLLFDTRQPLIPLLMWEHGLDHPSYVSIFRLSELRPLEEYKWASESGYAILAGSFWNDQFSLFCYGPREEGADVLDVTSLYAWELPSSLSLSGKPFGSGDNFLKEIFARENLSDGVECLGKRNRIAGFCLLTCDLFKFKSRGGSDCGFGLIRLMTSGKLEMQRYSASWDLHSDQCDGKENALLEVKDHFVCSKYSEDKVSTRYYFLRLQYLNEYLKGNLSKLIYISNGLSDSISKDLKSPIIPVSSFLSEVSVPTSIFEIASRIVLNNIGQDLWCLAFSKSSDLFGGNGDPFVELLELPRCLPCNKTLPFFVERPSSRSSKWSRKASIGEAIVGPVLPLPVLVTLQSKDVMDKSNILVEEEPADDLLTLQCKPVLDYLNPEVSLADDDIISQKAQIDNTYFIHEPACVHSRSTCNGTDNLMTFIKKEPPHMAPETHNSSVSDVNSKDERFSTFLCGIGDKVSCPDSPQESVGLEMFDLSPVRLDFDSPNMVFEPDEYKVYKCLKRQFATWLNDYKPYQNFCSSSKNPELA